MKILFKMSKRKLRPRKKNSNKSTSAKETSNEMQRELNIREQSELNKEKDKTAQLTDKNGSTTGSFSNP